MGFGNCCWHWCVSILLLGNIHNCWCGGRSWRCLQYLLLYVLRGWLLRCMCRLWLCRLLNSRDSCWTRLFSRGTSWAAARLRGSRLRHCCSCLLGSNWDCIGAHGYGCMRCRVRCSLRLLQGCNLLRSEHLCTH